MGPSLHSVRSLWQKGFLLKGGGRFIHLTQKICPEAGKKEVKGQQTNTCYKQNSTAKHRAEWGQTIQPCISGQHLHWGRLWNLSPVLKLLFNDRSLQRRQAIFNTSISPFPAETPWQTFLWLHSKTLSTTFTNKRKCISLKKKGNLIHQCPYLCFFFLDMHDM